MKEQSINTFKQSLTFYNVFLCILKIIYTRFTAFFDKEKNEMFKSCLNC